MFVLCLSSGQPHFGLGLGMFMCSLVFLSFFQNKLMNSGFRYVCHMSISGPVLDQFGRVKAYCANSLNKMYVTKTSINISTIFICGQNLNQRQLDLVLD